MFSLFIITVIFAPFGETKGTILSALANIINPSISTQGVYSKLRRLIQGRCLIERGTYLISPKSWSDMISIFVKYVPVCVSPSETAKLHHINGVFYHGASKKNNHEKSL